MTFRKLTMIGILAIYLFAYSLLVSRALPLETDEFNTMKSNFTLAAINATVLANANSTGAPLVLGQDGGTRGLYFYVTSTYASYPYDDYPAMALVDGELHAFTGTGEWITNATEVRSGETLGWITTTIYTSLAPKVYSAIRYPGRQYALLSAHGTPDLWSLCTFPSTYPQNNVVFNVSAVASSNTAGHPRFDLESCYSVFINIVPLH